MTQPLQVSAGHLLRPQAGDLLVFTTEKHMTRDQAERFAAVMQEQLPGVKALMLDASIQLAEIHTSQEIQRLKGELLVVTTLLKEALEVVRNVEAESTDEEGLLGDLIQKGEAAVRKVLTGQTDDPIMEHRHG